MTCRVGCAPLQVARSIIRGIESRQFSVSTGLDGFMLANLTCGMEPVFSVLQGMVQVRQPSPHSHPWREKEVGSEILSTRIQVAPKEGADWPAVSCGG